MNYDKQQAEDVMTNSIAQLVGNNKNGLVKILRKNGVDIDKNISDNEIITAVYTGVAKSPAFALDLKKLIYSTAQDAYASSPKGYASAVGDGKANTGLDWGGVTASGGGSTGGLGTLQQTSGTGTKFGQTGIGKFLGGLFTKDTVSGLVNTGVNALSSKLAAKQDQKMLENAIALKAQETQAALAKEQEIKARNKWLVPTVVIGGIVLVVVVGIIVYKKTKK